MTSFFLFLTALLIAGLGLLAGAFIFMMYLAKQMDRGSTVPAWSDFEKNHS